MNKTSTKLILFLFLVNLAIRLPLIGSNFWKTPDAVEYLNIAQNLKSGHGLTTSIKIHFFNNQPVVHSALSERPIGFSLFLTPLLFIKNSPEFIQLFLLLLNSINAILFFFFLRYLLKPPLPFIGSLLFTLNPNILITNRLIMPEPVYFFFIITTLLFFYQKKIPKNLFISGLLLGFAYLVRPESLFLLFSLSLYLIINKKFKAFIPLLAAFSLISLPYHLFNYLLHGQLFSVIELYHYQIPHFSIGMKNFGLNLLSISDFISSNFIWIIIQQLKNLILHLRSLASFTWLGFLFPFVFLSSRKFIHQHFFLLLFGILSFTIIVFTWAIFAEPERMLFIPFISILPFSLQGLSYLKPSKIIFLVFALTIGIYLAFDTHRLIWAKNKDIPTQNLPHSQQITNWINTHTASDNIIASPDPWLISLTTSRPSIMLPSNLTSSNFQKFINTYKINYLITDQVLSWPSLQLVFNLPQSTHFIYKTL